MNSKPKTRLLRYSRLWKKESKVITVNRFGVKQCSASAPWSTIKLSLSIQPMMQPIIMRIGRKSKNPLGTLPVRKPCWLSNQIPTSDTRIRGREVWRVGKIPRGARSCPHELPLSIPEDLMNGCLLNDNIDVFSQVLSVVVLVSRSLILDT
jgi:hypothetical protein